jgi:hypothetical protein
LSAYFSPKWNSLFKVFLILSSILRYIPSKTSVRYKKHTSDSLHPFVLSPIFSPYH